MQKWEYLVFNQTRKSEGLLGTYKAGDWSPDIDLEKLGNEGWELVVAIPSSSRDGAAYAGISTELQWVFKRPAFSKN